MWRVRVLSVRCAAEQATLTATSDRPSGQAGGTAVEGAELSSPSPLAGEGGAHRVSGGRVRGRAVPIAPASQARKRRPPHPVLRTDLSLQGRGDFSGDRIQIRSPSGLTGGPMGDRCTHGGCDGHMPDHLPHRRTLTATSDRPSGQAGGKAVEGAELSSPSPLAGEGGARRVSGGRVRGWAGLITPAAQTGTTPPGSRLSCALPAMLPPVPHYRRAGHRYDGRCRRFPVSRRVAPRAGSRAGMTRTAPGFFPGCRR